MVDSRKRNQVNTLPQIKVSSVMRVSQAGTDTIPMRHRIANRMIATSRTRTGPWARIDTRANLEVDADEQDDDRERDGDCEQPVDDRAETDGSR